MSNRYSIDEPAGGIDEEADIVFGGDAVTDRDRDLLRADDEVLETLGRAGIHGQNGRGGANGDNRLSRAAKKWLPSRGRKVKFGGEDYRMLANDDIESAPESAGKAHRLQTFRGPGASNNGRRSSDLSDDSDLDFDIEIDLDTRHPRRRNRNSQVICRVHILVVIAFALAAWLFLTNVLWAPSGDSRDNSSLRRPIAKTAVSNGTHDFYPTTVVVSLDGFHPHYVSQDLTPNLHRLFVNGSGFPYMTPSFPSSTFPNHWTLVTGLYPAHHGIVGNTFFDTKTGKQFVNVKPDMSLAREWWGGEPIWATAALQGVKTAVHMWPGSEVAWGPEGEPAVVDKFNGSEVLSAKRDRVLSWLDEPSLEDRPELILAYVPTVDTIGHKYGVAGQELKDALADVDALVGSIMGGIQDRSLEDIVNLVVLSDHGMAPTSNDRVAFIEDLVDINTVEHMDGWPLVALRFNEDTDIAQTYADVKAKETPDGGWKVYRKEDLPREWNFGGKTKSPYDSRLAPLWLIPTVGWSLTTREKLAAMPNGEIAPKGVHGYNSSESLMRALFVAQGPYFDIPTMYHPIPNVDVYNILCDTLGLTPSSNDGAPAPRTLIPLAPNWQDPQPYPGVPFHPEILKLNSTYDELFGGDRSSSSDKELETSPTPLPSPTTTDDPPTTASPTASAASSTSTAITHKLYDWISGVGNAAADAWSSAVDWVGGLFSGSKSSSS